MKLIVGLGNPGKEYTNTRHNVGFMFLDSFLNEKFGDVSWKNKFNGLCFQNIIGGEKVVFLKPLSFMNLSGTVIQKYLKYFDIKTDDVLVVSDDLDLEFGNFKLKDHGSSGGHNGLKSIEENLGTADYKRLKIGISNRKDIDTKDYVLGKFTDEDISKLKELFKYLSNVLDDYFVVSFSDLMNKYNKKNR